jgi:fructose PTS system EIIBC or EIIC component
VKFVGVTSCPTGIAHTYMAAEGLEQSARAAGHEIQVETQGSAGFEPLSPETIAAADAVIFAADVPVRDRARFAGKPLVEAPVKKAISDGPGLISQAVAAAEQARANPEAFAASQAAAPAGRGGGGLATKVDKGAPVGTRIRQWLMTGVSYMIPFVAAGGIMIALGFMVAQLAGGKNGAILVTKLYSLTGPPDPNPTHIVNIVTDFNPTDGMHWAALLFLVGAAAFGFLVPILSGFIAFAIADRPGLAPGIVGGAIASTMGAGFLGGIATGFIGGFAALWISRWKVPKGVRGIMPVVVIPLLSTLITGAVLVLILGRPLKGLSDGLASWLHSLSGANLIILGVILGLMMGFDLGGPVNKVAYTFATAGLQAAGTATDAPALKIMAAVMAAGMVAPLGMALATTVRPRLFSEPERENGQAAWLLGASFISEGAIPFAAADPWRVIVSSMSGSAVTGALVMAFGNTLRAPHGGIWVVPLIGSPLLYILAIAIGTVVCTAVVVVLKTAGPGPVRTELDTEVVEV